MESHNINKLPVDGYLVFPLSMSRLAGGQSPEDCYEMIEYFETKIQKVGLDLVPLYTNGLYYNNDESALEVRKRTNGQMLSHRNRLSHLLEKNKKYITQAVHFLPWDYTILNSARYDEFFQVLKKESESNEELQELVLNGLGDRDASEANINFLLEEIVVNHLIREHIIEFPRTLVKKDTFRLIVYPGPHIEADAYQVQNELLPKNKECSNPYRAAHYNFTEKKLIQFTDTSKD